MDDPEIVDDVLAAWSSCLSVRRVEPLRRVTNPVWIVVDEDGRRFVLKQLPEYPPGVGTADEFRVLCHLAGVGIPVAVPVVTDDAQLAGAVDGKRYTLLPFIESDTTNHELGPDAASTSRAIGGAIARLDSALATCPWQPRSYVDDPAREILRDVVPKLPDVAELVGPIADALWAATHDLPTQRTHGDCNTGNVLVRGTNVSGFLDLDHLPIGPRVRDLSYYLASRLQGHLARAGTAERDAAALVDVLGDYVAGSHEVSPLADREVAAVVPLMLLIEVGSANWCLNGWVPSPVGYEQSISAVRWIVHHLDELSVAATNMTTGRN